MSTLERVDIVKIVQSSITEPLRHDETRMSHATLVLLVLTMVEPTSVRP